MWILFAMVNYTIQEQPLPLMPPAWNSLFYKIIASCIMKQINLDQIEH